MTISDWSLGRDVLCLNCDTLKTALEIKGQLLTESHGPRAVLILLQQGYTESKIFLDLCGSLHAFKVPFMLIILDHYY